MILKHDAHKSEDSTVAEPLAAKPGLESGDDSTDRVETPSFLRGVQECERLLQAVWPGVIPLGHELPRQFGKFTIVRELGRGGFGIVFLAFDTKLRRQVALKLPRPEIMVTPDFRIRFLREAEAASRFDHPHIVPVYEVGEEGPICFIASAYCEGPTLAAWLRGQPAPVPVGVAARLVAVLSSAVAHAHERSILHRDLKPGNILLHQSAPLSLADEPTRDALTLHPRICDFGLAKLLDQVSQETCTGVPIGSASYMAPEQASGRVREQGPATDVYALGVILYELLTGQPPFQGETDLETLRLVSDLEPLSPRALRHGLPRDLATITQKCLEKSPSRRYATAAELSADLKRFLDGKPVRARPVPVWEQAGKWIKRRPVHAALAAVITLGLAGTIGLSLWSGAWLRWHHQDKREAVVAAEDSAHEHMKQLSERSAQDSQVRLIHESFEEGKVGLAALMLNEHQPALERPEVDEFAWNYVRGRFRPDVTQLGEPRNDYPAVLQLAISPDGATLAAGHSDGTVSLWDLAHERLRAVLVHASGPESEIYHLRFSPDGRYLATVNPPKSTKIWDMATLQERATISNKTESASSNLHDVFALRFTDSGSCLLTLVKDNGYGKFVAWFWSVPAPGEQPRILGKLNQGQFPGWGGERPPKGPSWPAPCEANAPWLSYVQNHLVILDDGVSLAIKDSASDATLFDHQHYTIAARIRGPMQMPVIQGRPLNTFGAADMGRVSRSARRVVGGADSERSLWNRPADVTAFSPDGLTAALHLGGHHLNGFGVILIDVASNRSILTNVPARWRVVDFAFTPDGQTLAVAGFDSQIHLWHLKRNALAGHQKEIGSLAFSPDGKCLASGAADHTVKLWDVAGLRERLAVQGHRALVTAVAYSADGTLLASASFDKTIRLCSAATGEHKGTLVGHTDRLRALAFSPDGKTLASAGDDRVIRLWDVENGSELSAPLNGHAGSVYSLAFAPDGKTLYSGALDKTIILWDPRRGRVHQTWRTEDEVYSLAVSPDGETLAAGYHGGKVVLWDVAHEKVRAILKGHAGDVLGIAFSPDGQTLASAGRDQMVRLWDPAAGQELLSLKGHQAPVRAVSFSPDGTILASGSHDGAIKLWRAPRSDRQ